MSAIQSEAEKSELKTELKPGERYPAPHGRGTLIYGNPGNKGGTGRPEHLAKKLAAQGVMQAMPGIVDIAMGISRDGSTIYPSQQVAATKLLADIGIPKEVITHTVEHRVAGILESVARVLAAELGIETRDHLLTLIQQDVKDNAEVSTSVSQDVETQ